MDTFGRQQDATTTDSDDLEVEAIVTCHTTRPGKAVFTERDNCDGWIATDLTVRLEP